MSDDATGSQQQYTSVKNTYLVLGEKDSLCFTNKSAALDSAANMVGGRIHTVGGLLRTHDRLIETINSTYSDWINETAWLLIAAWFWISAYLCEYIFYKNSYWEQVGVSVLIAAAMHALYFFQKQQLKKKLAKLLFDDPHDAALNLEVES